MLVIRKDQQEALAQPLLESFVHRMTLHLQKAFVKDVGDLSEGELQDAILRYVGRAKEFGVVIEADVARYIEYAFCYREEFALNSETGWAAEVLNDSGLDGTAKMDRIDQLNRFFLGS